METKLLYEHREEDDFNFFYQKIEPFIPNLKKFITGSLKVAEDQAMLDKRFYNPDEMLDEVFLEAFIAFSGEKDQNELRRKLFKKALQKIAAKEEDEVPDEVNTHSLLKKELKALS